MPEPLNYPHLSDIDYPAVEDVEVFDYGYDEYDWTRWTDNVKLKLCNVPWESDGSNAVKFDSEAARNAWFDNLQGKSVEVRSFFHEMPSQTMKVPLPFPVAMTYNYVMVQTPVMPTAGQPLEFENASSRYERTFWYIMDVHSTAPNTTELTLLQDYWTNYIDQVDISYMMLRRGHAPVTKISASAYLNDPYHNKRYLLAEDVNFYESTCISGQRFYPFGNGEKYLCFAATMPLTNFDGSLGHAVTVQSQSSPTYSDVAPANMDKSPHPVNLSGESRDYRWQDVSAWNWSLQDRDYLNNDVSLEYYCNAGISSEVDVYAVKASQAEDFIRDMHWTYPQWFGCVVCAFDVSVDMFEKGMELDVWCYIEGTATKQTYTAWKVNRTSGGNVSVRLNKSDFAFPSQYADLAKLYTYPYSFLELSEAGGRTVQIRVEDVTADAALKFKTCFAFPWFKYTAFFEGIGGDAEDATFVWHTVAGGASDVSIGGGDWQKLLFEHDIPTFAVYRMSEELWALDNGNEVEAARNRAIVDYEDTADAANTQYWNRYYDAGVVRDNSYRSANAMRGNTNALASARKGNADDSADAAYDIMQVSRNIDSYKQTTESAYIYNSFLLAADKANADRALAARQSVLANQTQYANGVISTALGGMSSVFSGASAGALAGMAGGPLGMEGGAMVGGAVALGTSTFTALTNYATLGNNTTLVSASNKEQGYYFNAYYGGLDPTSTNVSFPDSFASAYGAMGSVSQSSLAARGQDLDTDILQNRIYAERNMLLANGRTSRALVKGGTGGAVTNMAVFQDGASFGGTSVRNYNAETGNAQRTYDADTGNADDRRSIDRHNANETRKSSIRQAKRTMEQRRQDTLAGFEDSRHGAHRQQGTYMGDGSVDVYRWRGVQLKVRTQPQGAIHQAGDQMLRYGYFLNQNWDFESFNLMKHFTYWEVSEIWLTGGDKGVPEDGQERIKRMLRDGVTVWHNPDDIGKVSIYDNLKWS